MQCAGKLCGRMDRLARRRVDVVTDTCYGGLHALCGEGVWVYMDRLARRHTDTVTDACCGDLCGSVCGEGVWASGALTMNRA